jgi:hypothetical protein
MNNLVVNIGLNVGNLEPNSQAHETLSKFLELFHVKSNGFKVDKSSWEGATERVLVFKTNAGRLSSLAISSILSMLCLSLNQDAIAFKLNGEGFLAFNPNYSGERYTFSEEYFINF